MTNLNAIRVKALKLCFSLIIIYIAGSAPASAQYFGQNLVRYKNLKFRVHQSQHFELYAYLRNDSITTRFLQ